MLKKDLPLDSIQNIRTALRKRTVQTAIYKNQAEHGAQCQNELLAYIELMTEEECFEFLNSIREAPFLPGVNVMWTEEVADYLMFGDLPSNMRYSMDRCNSFDEYFNKSSRIEPVSYNTSYMKKHVDERYWHLLPTGWCANYYSPSQVLRLAIHFHRSSPLAQHIAEKLFIKAADLEDCLKPTTKAPAALPRKARVRKVAHKNEVVLKDFPEGSHIAIDLPGAGKPLAPKITEIPKAPKVPKIRRNPVVAAQPMFAAKDECPEAYGNRDKEIDKAIIERYVGFGGKETAGMLADALGVTTASIYKRASMLYKKHSIEKRKPIDTMVKEQYRGFGGNLTQRQLAQNLNVNLSTVGRHIRNLRKEVKF